MLPYCFSNYLSTVLSPLEKIRIFVVGTIISWFGILECLAQGRHIARSREIFIKYVHECVLSHFSHVRLFATLWTVAHQAPLSMGFSRQEYWSGLPFLPPGDLPNPAVEPMSCIGRQILIFY